MRFIKWSALAVAGAMLFGAVAEAQLSKGRGPGGSPPGQSGGPKSPPSQGGGQSGGPKSPPPSKGDQNPPVRGNQGPPPTKGDQNPPVRGNQGPPPPTKGDQNPPVRGNQGPPPPTKGDQNPPVRGNQGPPPPTKGDQNPPVRGNQGPPPPTKGDQNPPVRGNQGPPLPTKGDQNPPVRGNQGPPSNQGGGLLGGGPRGGAAPIKGSGSGNNNQGLNDRWVKVRDTRNTKGSYNGSTNNVGPVKQPPQIIRTVPNLSISNQAIREDDVRRRSNIYRSGYHHYDSNWRDDYFWCGNYIFDPWRVRCVVSPWYYYHSLPGYLSYNCIRIVTIPIYVWSGRRYNYVYNTGWGNNSYNNRSDLDYAIDDLRDAFENGDRRSLNRVIGRDSRIDIFTNGKYDYSLDSEEFYNVMLDGIYNADTSRYEVVNVETYRDEAEVVARHEFTDPWGRRSSVYHWYRLENTRRGYVITRFGTSEYNAWR